MKRFCLLALLAAVCAAQSAYAQQTSQPKEELKCDPNPKPGEGFKQITYTKNGKQYIEYCSRGKKYTIVDSGENG